jgi:DnaA family protein
MKQLLLDVLPAQAPSLENYVPGPNAEALAALRALPSGRAVYLWGPAASGRTHLLRAMVANASDAIYLDNDAPIKTFQAVADGDASHALLRRVAIDDLHAMDDARQACVFALYNRWRESAATEHALSLVVAGDRAPHQMQLREDLRTRLGWDLVFRLDALSDADKMAALGRQAASRGMQLAPDVLNWVITHFDRDMRRLSALVDALDRYSLAAKRPITVPLLRAMLAEQPEPSNPDSSPPTLS